MGHVLRSADDDITITEGSGNVFADLGLPDSDAMLVKAGLALQIKRAIKARGLTTSAAAEILGTDQPKVSNIMNGKLRGFSWERLATFLTKLSRDVEIRVTPRVRGTGRLRVKAA